MNTDFIKGVVVPMITPIDAEEKIDEASFRRQIDYIIDGGLHGILVFGSNGEFYQIEEDEMERGLKLAVDQAAGRVPVYFGIGAVYEKFVAGDLAGSLEAQFKLNPVRLSMDAASFPVAAKDMAALRGLDAGAPYLPSLPTPASVLEEIKAAMREAELI